MPGTAIEKLRKANDDYHEAVDGVLKSEDYDAKTKCSFAEKADGAFNNMAAAESALSPREEV